MLLLNLFPPPPPALLLPGLLVAQVCKALADATAHGSPQLARWFPRWCGQLAWTLKYQRGDPNAGPAFPGSTTWLVWATDGWHAFNALGWLGWAVSLGLACLVGRAGLWWVVGGLVGGKLVFEPLYKFLRK